MEDHKKNNEPIQSYENVDPKKQKADIEARLKQIAEMPKLDEDMIEEKKRLERLLDNLSSNDEPRAY